MEMPKFLFWQNIVEIHFRSTAYRILEMPFHVMKIKDFQWKERSPTVGRAKHYHHIKFNFVETFFEITATKKDGLRASYELEKFLAIIANL